jgi:hypothetical protein
MAKQNGFTERYAEELKAQMASIETVVIRGVDTHETYIRLIGKHSGIAAALAYFEELLAALEQE